ncbi:MAG: TIM barrel protein [Algoriphagus sp.]|uniref:sugar phosphate isomerase/epimerase family protein n=1 Tax=Algoriphagus sp. TaxID=1872435 RepID=UPI002610590C|nr:TIM barrel protein [Algoriphagus sp.]MDG1276612.1 TIM barrel protein [Algoriphagus sp.]
MKTNIRQEDRRSFLKTSGLGIAALAFPFQLVPDYLKDVPMGVVVHSYGARWHSKVESSSYRGFQDALDLMAHCHQIGAGGIQVGVNGWQSDFAKKVRDQREQMGMYLEGSIGLPKSSSEVAAFEMEVKAAKEAGATILRTVCLSGRRYENFHSAEEFQAFKTQALQSIHLAIPIVEKHKIKLAVENHKDWKAAELAAIIRDIDSEWLGVTLDFGNNVSLLEDPMEVIRTLAPLAFSTHIKDMGVKKYSDGFLLSEVPLGQGIVDVKEGVKLCRKYNPAITFSLEMITRDPLKIPCMTEGYWATFEEMKGEDFEKTMAMVEKNEFKTDLPSTSNLDSEGKLAFEEANVLECLKVSRKII